MLHHSLLAFLGVALTLAFLYLFPKRDLVSRLSIGTAYPALFFTAATMLLGPLNLLLRKPNPVSFDLRRDLGIWSGILAIFHTVVGLNVHLRGRIWLYFVNDHNQLRRDLFGFGNYTGIVAALVFGLLLALSNDLSLRKLGLARWKFLQRWAYVAAALTIAHAIAYQQIEKRILPFALVVYGTAATLLALQLIAARKQTIAP
jgi:sulfoxide reductase heme-binding subunit YedZ